MSNSGKSSENKSAPWQSYQTVFTNAKAGMDGVDKEKVQKIVYEMSKGSKYFENEQRKTAYIKERIEQLQQQAAILSDSDITNFMKIADKKVLELEARRDLSKTWMHVDMDAFYAAVETLENPSLAGKPMAVGSMSMLSTANYEARKFGVRAAMPGFIARKLCPDLIIVPTNFEKYSHYSGLTRKVFQEYDAKFIARSLDEAYLDITNVCKQRCMSGESVAEEIRHAVHAATGLTCSAGVAANRMLAKVSSDINKPNGQFILPNDLTAIMEFVSSLPIRKVSGIGKVTEQMLKDVLGINTCKDLLQQRAMVCALFSKASADFFLSMGLGLGGVEPPEEEHRKSISTERTFSATSNENELFNKLDEIADALSKDMEKEGLSGRTLTLKLKTASFEVRTRAVSLQFYIHKKEDILNHGKKLLRAELPLSLRLIGLRISHFNDGKAGPIDPMQKTLTSYFTKGSNVSHQEDCKIFNNTGMDIFDFTQIGGTYAAEDKFTEEENRFSNLEISDASNSIMKYYHPVENCKNLKHSSNIIGQVPRTSSESKHLDKITFPEMDNHGLSNIYLKHHQPTQNCKSAIVSERDILDFSEATRTSFVSENFLENRNTSSISNNDDTSSSVPNTYQLECSEYASSYQDEYGIQGSTKENQHLLCPVNKTRKDGNKAGSICSISETSQHIKNNHDTIEPIIDKCPNNTKLTGNTSIASCLHRTEAALSSLKEPGAISETNCSSHREYSMEQGSSSRSCIREENTDLVPQFSKLMFWKDGYRCSLCGIELPASFVEEQQEHSDYHLAEILQQKESSSEVPRDLNSRSIRNNQKPSHGKRKIDKKLETPHKKIKHGLINSFYKKATDKP